MAEPVFTTEADAVYSQTLQRPVNAFGKLLDAIHFREPKAGDITRHGQPVNYTPGYDFSTITFNEPKMTAMMAALSGVPQGSLDSMTTQDWTDCAWGVARFFIPGVSTKRAEPPSTSQSTSGATSSTISTEAMPSS